jgi:hypothetical protein
MLKQCWTNEDDELILSMTYRGMDAAAITRTFNALEYGVTEHYVQARAMFIAQKLERDLEKGRDA